MRRSVSGIMDYNRLAQMNRPMDQESLRNEVRRLRTTGLTAADIAVALRLGLPQVLEMLRATS